MRWEQGQWRRVEEDPIAPEAPLAIRLIWGKNEDRQAFDLAITMRSPGADDALIHGYLFSEGIISNSSFINRIEYPSDDTANVHLEPQVQINPTAYQRSSYANSSCGLCGKTDLGQIEQTIPYFPSKNQPKVLPGVLRALPDALRERQQLFAETGGIHATALFEVSGALLAITEDVGRHNALDKLLGTALLKGDFPWRNKVVLLSGRISYELVQKTAMAGTPILAAIGAPSTAAIELAIATGMTLVGFLRKDRMNVYTYPERIS